MKQIIRYMTTITIISVIVSSCSKNFFNRPPESGVAVGNYYQTTDQVKASTNGLYGSPWFGWNNKVGWAITEISGGNGRSYSSDVNPFGTPPVANDNAELLASWDSPFSVVAQANGIINNLPTSVPSSVPKDVVNNALGEAHLMRGVAYFYLVRTFGNIPLVENPLDDVDSFQTVPTNPVIDVYRFIENDLKFAESNCTPNVAGTGHGSSGSASAMLAKVYLYEQKYDSARIEAEKVINSGEFSLLPDFGDLFRTKNNNNKESILAMQWVYNAGYDYGNSIQSSWAYSSTITGTGDGYGVLGPTIDLQSAFKAEGDTIRRHYTIMLPGEYYPEIDFASGGYTLPLSASSQGTDAEPKKYVIGTPQDPDNNGKTATSAGGNNTYIMRYADVLLIEAEAILGQSSNPGVGHGIPLSASTSDPDALKYYNMIRNRAGLSSVTAFTYQELLNERRLEFALEQDYWFDLCRIDGFNPPTWVGSGVLTAPHPIAEAIIANQERGTYNNPYPDQTSINSMKINMNDIDFLFHVPVAESNSDPNLLKAPVSYNFK